MSKIGLKRESAGRYYINNPGDMVIKCGNNCRSDWERMHICHKASGVWAVSLDHGMPFRTFGHLSDIRKTYL